jgi:hypothetical protein
MITYKIKNWDLYYENHDSRKYKNLTWIPISNKWDGLGFSRLKKQPEVVEILAGWLMILQIASKCKPRGVLIRENLPLSPADMADITGLPENMFIVALNVLSDKNKGICWIESEGEEEMGLKCNKTGESPAISRSCAPILSNLTLSNLKEPLPLFENIELSQKWEEWKSYKKGHSKKIKNYDMVFEKQFNQITGFLKTWKIETIIKMLDDAMCHGWQSYVEEKLPEYEKLFTVTQSQYIDPGDMDDAAWEEKKRKVAEHNKKMGII